MMSPQSPMGEKLKHGNLKFSLFLFILHLSIRMFQEFHCSLDRLTETWERDPTQFSCQLSWWQWAFSKQREGHGAVKRDFAGYHLWSNPHRGKRRDNSSTDGGAMKIANASSPKIRLRFKPPLTSISNTMVLPAD